MKPAASGPKTRLASDLADFAKRIGHEFRNPDFLVRAVTHSSLSSATRPSNERLEFLGDRVLGLSIATALFQTDDRAAEGQLAPRFNALVRQETCAEVAREIGLGEVLKLGRSEMMSGGRRKEALLGDAMEAVIAHLFRWHPIEAITAEADPRNAASLGLLARLGFAETHRAERTLKWRDEWCDSVYLALRREDWA